MHVYLDYTSNYIRRIYKKKTIFVYMGQGCQGNVRKKSMRHIYIRIWRFYLSHVISCRTSQKSTVDEILDFLKSVFGLNITQKNSKNEKLHCWTSSIWTKFGQWILCNETIFFSHGRKWVQLWFRSYDKIKI